MSEDITVVGECRQCGERCDPSWDLCDGCWDEIDPLPGALEVEEQYLEDLELERYAETYAEIHWELIREEWRCGSEEIYLDYLAGATPHLYGEWEGEVAHG